MKPTSSATMSSVPVTSCHSADKNTQKNKSRNWRKGRGGTKRSVLVNQGLKKIKLDKDFIPVKVEANLTTVARSENGDGDDMFTEEFTVTKDEVNSSVVPPEQPGQEGQSSSSYSCRGEVEALKTAVKQLTLQVHKQNEMITNIKSILRIVILCEKTCCQEDDEDGDGGVKSAVIDMTSKTTSRSVSVDPLVMQNDDDKDFEAEDDKHSEVGNDMAIEKKSLYSCRLCTKKFKSYDGVYKHKQTVHKGVRYNCSKCPAQFTQPPYLKLHEYQVHKDGGPPTQECEICGVHLLESKYSLRIHMSKMHKKSVSESTHRQKGVERLRKKVKPGKTPAMLSVMTSCQDDGYQANRDGDGGGESAVIDVTSEPIKACSRSVSEGPLLIQNAERQECIDVTKEQEIPEDNLEGMNSNIWVAKCSGVPSVFSNKSFALLEDFTSIGGSRDLGQNTVNAEVDDDKDFGADENKHPEEDDDKHPEEDDDKHPEEDDDKHPERGCNVDKEKESLYKCHLCSKAFKNPSSIYQHIQSVHKGIRYKCIKCPGIFTHAWNLQRHENLVHKVGGPPTQKCRICGIHLLKSKTSLANHMRHGHRKSESKSTHRQKSVHKIAEPEKTRTVSFQCQHCLIFFPEKDQLSCHVSQVHGITSGKEGDK